MQHPKMFAFLLAVGLLLSPAGKALAFDPNYILSDDDLKDSFSMDLPQIQAFLSRGFLGEYRTADQNGNIRSAAQIIYNASQNYGISPRFLLVLLQKEQSLISDNDPSSKQLDWATGYAICDSCDLADPAFSRWQGFGKQVNSAALQFMDGYMADITQKGRTAGSYGPGVPVVVDGTTIIPANAATASLYAYTPHLHGNKNFSAIWNSWFGRDYPDGTLMQVPGEKGVWLLQDGYRRAITSQAALRSRFNASLVVNVSHDVLDRFPDGHAISLPNYTIVKDDNGKISLLVDDALRHIDTMETYHAVGFSEDEIVGISNDEAGQYEVGEEITSKSLYPQGRLLQLKTNGAVFYVADGTRHAILDKSVMTARFPGATLFPIAPVEVEQFKEGKALGMPDGSLVKIPDDPTVYVITDGMKRAIPTESIFTSYGYAWKNIVTVTPSVLKLHPPGDPLSTSADDQVKTANR
ncbi:MAG: hypothetical protein WC802_00885 [Patescibacteria group bacterium]|jgi:hypothetical protein